jgi:radical SAM superfamily enzyme YgiQ (UPF0313 family)
MRIGILELLTDTPVRGWREKLYAAYFRRQFVSIMPQVVSVWCRQLGHTVQYATYYGQDDPLRLLPTDLDLVFISTYTQASALAYALAKVFRRRHVRTVIGGPHAKAFPSDCARFFDLVVKDCDKTLIGDILRDRFSQSAIVSSNRPLTELPSVAERMPEIAVSVFSRGRPRLTSIVPILSSLGCPYSCDFCIDWNNKYIPLPKERLRADLEYLAANYPQVLIGYHDPNFAIRFDETMDTIESIPAERRNRYLMESSLSVLKPGRLHRLKSTRCAYIAPGVESWAAYSNKAGVGAKRGSDKLEEVVNHFEAIHQYVPGLQANFIFGADDDHGEEPVELTKDFIRRAPFVFPTINIPTPFGGTPLFDRYLAEGRVLRSMPFAFYYNPYLVITLRHYEPADYYRHLIDIYATATSVSAVARRAKVRSPTALRFVHELRGFALRREMKEFERLRRRLLTDRSFLAFHEGRSTDLPAYYRHLLSDRLGPYASLLSEQDLIPALPGSSVAGSCR